MIKKLCLQIYIVVCVQTLLAGAHWPTPYLHIFSQSTQWDNKVILFLKPQNIIQFLLTHGPSVGRQQAIRGTRMTEVWRQRIIRAALLADSLFFGAHFKEKGFTCWFEQDCLTSHVERVHFSLIRVCLIWRGFFFTYCSQPAHGLMWPNELQLQWRCEGFLQVTGIQLINLPGVGPL